MKRSEMAKKAFGGDGEAMSLLILESPDGDMGEDSEMEYAHRVMGDGEDPYSAKKEAVREALQAFLEGGELDAAVEAVCEAIQGVDSDENEGEE